MSRAVLPLLLVLGSLVIAGCAGGAPKTAPTSSDAPKPTHDADTGAIHGVVTDEELLPIPGARVGLVQEQQQTNTVENGSYAFGGLLPGKYQVVYEALGYQSAGKTVEVMAGQTTRSDVALVGIEITGEATVVAIPKVIQLNLDGPWSIDTTEGPYINVSQYQDLRCNPCYAVLHYAPGEKGVMTEVHWSGTFVSPVTNNVIFRYVRNWTAETGPSTSTGSLVHRPILHNDEGTVWPDTAAAESRKSRGLMKFFITIPRDSLAVNMKIETWTSFAYNAPIPEDYSALPPKA